MWNSNKEEVFCRLQSDIGTIFLCSRKRYQNPSTPNLFAASPRNTQTVEAKTNGRYDIVGLVLVLLSIAALLLSLIPRHVSHGSFVLFDERRSSCDGASGRRRRGDNVSVVLACGVFGVPSFFV